MDAEEQWWPDVPWRLEGFRADPALKDGFLALHHEIRQIMDMAQEQGSTEVTVDVQLLGNIYYALLAQAQMSNQSILLEIQDLRNELREKLP